MYIRYFLVIGYKGTHYYGWQKQPAFVTIQDTIEKALAYIHIPVKIVGSSRTDRGIHAKQQIAHLDLPSDIDPQILLRKLNKILPRDIYLCEIKKVQPIAHARFSALSRSYTYHIHTHRDPFLSEVSCYYPYRLDFIAMNKAASYLLGKKSCKSFCKGKTILPHYECHITKAAWQDKGSHATFFITANRFLHSMVRTLVGTLLEVGRGQINPTHFATIIKEQDRCKASVSAPPEGLFLIQVAYPDDIYKDPVSKG